MLKIKDCTSSVTIISSVSGDGSHGGLVACAGSNSAVVNIESCKFTGKLLTTGGTNNCGGFVGWKDCTITISDSLYAPADIGDGETEVLEGDPEQSPSATFMRNGSPGDNCYYTRALGTAQGKAMGTLDLPDGVTAAAESGGTYTQGSTVWYYPGKTVTLTVEPPEGYVTGSVCYAPEDGDSTDIPADANGAFPFTMPEGAVTVTANFISEWAALNQRFASASTDENDPTEITLANDVTAGAGDSFLTVEENTYVTLDLNGHTLNRNLTSGVSGGNVITVEGNLTVKDSSNPSTGKITGGKNSGQYGGGVLVNSGAVFTLESGSVTGNTITDDDSYGGGVCVYGTFNMSGGSISGNSCGHNGGGVNLYNGTFTMSDGSMIENNHAASDGGVSVYKDTFTMNGGSITGNTANSYGGGVYMTGTFKVSGAPVISGNTKNGSANNVFLPLKKTINIPNNTTLSSDASIGVTTGTARVFTSGLSGRGDLSNFFSDSNARAVRLDESGEAKLVPLHTVTLSAPQHGTLTASVGDTPLASGSKAAEGDAVTLTVKPAAGCVIGTVTYNDGTDHEITPEGGVYAFTMPDKDVTVTAVFEMTFKLADGTSGTVTAKVGDGEFETVTPNGSGVYRISKQSIAANNLELPFTFVVKVGDDTALTTTASVMDYISIVLNNAKADDEKSALAALYEYWAAADTY